MNVLFLCTGNYYRSRFAEEYFNHLAQRNSLPHRAASRGIGLNFERLKNPGPISMDVIIALKALGILVAAPIRRPQKLRPEEVGFYDRIICMDKKEHLPLVRKNRALKGATVEYWDIKDLGEVGAAVALPACRKRVEELVEEMKIEVIQDIETALNEIGENRGISHAEAHQRLKMRYLK